LIGRACGRVRQDASRVRGGARRGYRLHRGSRPSRWARRSRRRSPACIGSRNGGHCDKGYKVIVDNKPGAGGHLGTEAALREPADGHTLLAISPSYAYNAIIYKPDFDALGAIQAVVQFTQSPGVLVVPASSRFKNLQDFIVAAKQAPGQITYGSGGIGSLGHFSAEYFADAAGIKLKHVPYKTGVLNDLLAGHIDMMPAGSSNVRTLVKNDRVRVLVVSWPTRLPEYPDAPTFAEAGMPTVEVDVWQGLVASKDVPMQIVVKLNSDINEVLRDSALRARLAEAGLIPVGGTREHFRQVVANEFERWQRIAKTAGIKME